MNYTSLLVCVFMIFEPTMVSRQGRQIFFPLLGPNYSSYGFVLQVYYKEIIMNQIQRRISALVSHPILGCFAAVSAVLMGKYVNLCVLSTQMELQLEV